MPQLKRFIGSAITVTTAALVTVGAADVANAFQLFNNRQEWEAALSASPTTLDFSNVAGESVLSGTVLPNGLSVRYSQSVDGGRGFIGSATDTGLSFRRAIPQNTSPQTGFGLQVGFPSPVEAFGFDLSGAGAGSGVFEVAVPGVQLNEQPNRKNSITVFSPAFFGFISDPDTSVSRVTVECSSFSCVGIGTVKVDNISVVPRSESVPEPASTAGVLSMSLSGGAALLQQRKKMLKSGVVR